MFGDLTGGAAENHRRLFGFAATGLPVVQLKKNHHRRQCGAFVSIEEWNSWDCPNQEKAKEKQPRKLLTDTGRAGTIERGGMCLLHPKRSLSHHNDNKRTLQSIAKGGPVTQRAMKQLETLRRATARYSPRVKAQLSKAGKKSDSAIVESASKYYVALKKLANE
jgi:hypothetical protein